MSTEFQDTHGNSQAAGAGAGAFAPGGAPDSADVDSEELLAGTRELVEEIKRRLRAGTAFNNRSFSELANGTLGGSRMQGTFSAKYAYDVLESALNQLLLEQYARALMEMADPRLGLAHVLMPLVAQLPTQTDRTLDQQLLQQFSTPPTIGYVAARVLAPRKSDLVMEPSAGTGSLAIWPRAIGADVLTNEVSLRRLALLELLGFKPSSYDAEFLDDLYPPEVIPTAFLMNPPFSATGGRVERNNSLYGARHIETALRRMAQGGRLVSIAGEGMKLDRPAFRQWWQRIASAYTVRAVVGVDGKFYSKFGTTFDDSLIVIDKTGPTPGATWEAQVGSIKWGDAETLEQLWEMLARVAADRPEIGETRTKPPAPVVTVLPVEKEPAAEAQAGAAAPAVASGAPAATQSAPAPHAQQTTPARDDEADALVVKQEGEGGGEQEEADIFIRYTPAMLTGGVDHPALIVESRSMASVYPPPITYRPHFPRRVVKRGLLSALQLERVCYAGQAHDQRLPDGARGGFFVGDGTGVGKGRSQPLDAKILTPVGWKVMGEIKVGDEVIAADGTPTSVLGVYPQGRKAIYRVTFSDGSQTECSEDHLWLTQTKRQRYYDRHGMGVNYPKPKVLTTGEIASTITLSHSIPLVAPVQFPDRRVEIDPYLLGVLVADGSLRQHSVEITSADEEILALVSAGLPDGLEVKGKGAHQYHYTVRKKSGRKWKGLPRENNPLLVALRRCGLAGVKAPDKFIPEEYKLNTPGVRLAVLQGLMDCDGHAGGHGSCIYYTASERLADDVVFLVRSLGGIATRRLKETTHRPCHVIYVRLPAGVNPFRLKRKAGRVKPVWTKYPPQRLIKKVEPVGEKEAQCIAVEHPARLYVTDDFVVTHNTLAGIIVDNWFQGFDRAVWLSVNNDLMDSARRDLNDLGVRVPLHKINDFDVRKPITATCGVVFSSYSSLIASAKSGETRLRQLMQWLGPNGLLVLDECVPAGTKIATPEGEVPIEELKEGDLVLGYEHETGLVKPTPVKHLFRRQTTEPFVQIHETRLTGNHPVWTAEGGYVRADRLAAADRVGTLERVKRDEGDVLRLRVVPPVLHPQVPTEQEAEGGEAPVLQHLLLREVEDVAAGVREKADDGEEPKGVAREPEKDQGAPRRAAQAGRIPALALEPDLLAGNTAQGEKGVQEAGLRPPHGRERQGADRTAGSPAVEARLEGGALRGRETAEAGPALALQARFGGPGVEDRHRDRRPVPPDPRGEAPGREEDGVPGRTGVARAPVQERGGALRRRGGDRKSERVRRVYNIETGTGNYFANSLLVHNCHKAKNALAGGRGEPTQTGQAVIDLQSAERNPDYRVVYSSATGATDVRHMSYMVRLGLWGEGTPFPGGFGEFMTEIDSGGVGAMEMVCRDLKALGKYASASISFGMDPESGLSVEYREVIHRLTPEQRAMYDAMSEAWLIILQNIDQALELTNGDNRARANAMQKFWGDHQRCCRSVISAFKVPSLIAEVERELGAGHACVISLIGTGESKTKEQISKQTAGGGQIEDLDFSPREMICGMVDRGFPTTQYVEKTDPSTGQTIKVPLLDGEGKAVESKEALRMKQALLDKLSRLDLPEHPLDQLVNYFGPKHVAELTGRKRRLIKQPGGKLEYVKRNPDGVAMQNVNLYEMGLFQEGKKDIAIISDAASTGISLHADRRAGNQKRRVHLTLELNWSADKQLQTFGRTHRSNQVAPPVYVLLSTELGGEKRFSSTIAKRLASLGALTKGDRGAADGGDLTKYNFETDEGSAALNLLYGNILRGVHVDGLASPRQTLRNMGLLVRRQDGGEEVKKENLHNIPRFLNRVLALRVDEQNAMFNYFVELFEQTIRFAKANGTFDEGVQDIKAKAIRLGATPRVVHQDELTGAKTTHYKLEVDQPTRPVSFKEARETPRGTFYRQKKSGHYVLAAESGNHTDPNTGATYRTFSLTKPEAARAYYVKESELVEKYQPVQPRDAKMWWDFRYGQVPEVVTVEVHIIGGAILPLWQHLKTDEGAGLRVARVTTDDGLRIVGIQIPKAKLARVLRALGISRSFKEPAQIFAGVLEEGEEINLVGGLKLRKSSVHGEEAVEVICADPYRFDELRVFGLINESIAYKQRFFIPTDESKGLPVLTALLTRYPAISTEEEMKETTAADLDELLAQRVSDVDRADLVVNIEEHIIVPDGHEGDEEEQEVFSADPHASGQPTLQLVAGELNFEGTDEETEAGVEAKASPAPVEEDDETNFDVIPTSPAAAPASPQPSLFEQASAEVKPTKGKKNKKVDDGRQGLLWAA